MAARRKLTTYAYVQDVAEEWANYERLAASLGDGVPDGLIVHVAGPTDSGFRIIDVWESQEAWERFRNERLRPAARRVAGDASAQQPIFRGLRVLHVLRGEERRVEC
jgi:hypothetical protein